MKNWLSKLNQARIRIVSPGFIVFALICLMIGAGAGYLSTRGNQAILPTGETTADTATNNMPTTSTKAADLRVNFNNLATEHVSLLLSATSANLENQPSYAARQTALQDNTRNLTTLISTLHGQENATRFSSVWRAYIDTTIQYADAVKRADKAGTEAAVQSYNTFVDAFINYASSLDPQTDKSSLATLTTNYVTSIKSAIDKYASKDFAGSYTDTQSAIAQLRQFADNLSEAAVKQNASSYKD